MDEKRGDRGSQKPADTPAHPQSEKIDRKEKRFFTAQFAAVASLLTLLNLFISALGSGLVSRFHVILRYRREPFAEKLDLRFSIVNISTATFECSAPDLDSCPDESLPEFPFIGRSNVGKSSLLNLLTGTRDLARVSPRPGFTKLINFFLINKRWRLIDLPGYGYAHVARKDMARFNRAVMDYLQNRPNLCCVFALIDSGLTPQKMDLEFVEWLAVNSVPFVLVFTKTDTGNPTSVQKNIEAFKARIADWCETLPETYTCSAKALQGRGTLLGVVDAALKAQVEPSIETVAETPTSPAGTINPTLEPVYKKRPDRAKSRPW